MTIKKCKICGKGEDEVPFHNGQYNRCKTCHCRAESERGKQKRGSIASYAGYLQTSKIKEQVYDLAGLLYSDNSNAIGCEIPSDRYLATKLGMSRSTVRESLAVLTFLGYIKTVRSKGRFINKPIDLKDIQKSCGY